jgi:hypothetical protein
MFKVIHPTADYDYFMLGSYQASLLKFVGSTRAWILEQIGTWPDIDIF